MIVVLAIVQKRDAHEATSALTESGYRVTLIDTVGGFLDEPNVTLVLQTPRTKLDHIIELIDTTCHARKTTYIPAAVPGQFISPPVPGAMPVEIQIGGATIFAVRADKVCRIGQETEVDVSTHEGPAAMHLVMAIVRYDMSDDAVKALVDAGHRVTRIHTVGGFLRRGNMTLLIGCDTEQVDSVIHILEEVTGGQVEEAPLAKGMPSYGATVFVLPVERFERL